MVPAGADSATARAVLAIQDQSTRYKQARGNRRAKQAAVDEVVRTMKRHLDSSDVVSEGLGFLYTASQSRHSKTPATKPAALALAKYADVVMSCITRHGSTADQGRRGLLLAGIGFLFNLTFGAEGGDGDGTAMLGAAYHLGQAVDADQTEAMALLLLAERRGSLLAAPFLTGVRARLSDDELAESRRRADALERPAP